MMLQPNSSPSAFQRIRCTDSLGIEMRSLEFPPGLKQNRIFEKFQIHFSLFSHTLKMHTKVESLSPA